MSPRPGQIPGVERGTGAAHDSDDPRVDPGPVADLAEEGAVEALYEYTGRVL